MTQPACSACHSAPASLCSSCTRATLQHYTQTRTSLLASHARHQRKAQDLLLIPATTSPPPFPPLLASSSSNAAAATENDQRESSPGAGAGRTSAGVQEVRILRAEIANVERRKKELQAEADKVEEGNLNLQNQIDNLHRTLPRRRANLLSAPSSSSFGAYLETLASFHVLTAHLDIPHTRHHHHSRHHHHHHASRLHPTSSSRTHLDVSFPRSPPPHQEALLNVRRVFLSELLELFDVRLEEEEDYGRTGGGGEEEERWLIGGVVLPLSGDMELYPDQELQTAFHHTLHLVIHFSSYLSIPLPYPPTLGPPPSLIGPASSPYPGKHTFHPASIAHPSTASSATVAALQTSMSFSKALGGNYSSIPPIVPGVATTTSSPPSTTTTRSGPSSSALLTIALLQYDVVYLCAQSGLEIPLAEAGAILKNLVKLARHVCTGLTTESVARLVGWTTATTTTTTTATGGGGERVLDGEGGKEKGVEMGDGGSVSGGGGSGEGGPVSGLGLERILASVRGAVAGPSFPGPGPTITTPSITTRGRSSEGKRGESEKKKEGETKEERRERRERRKAGKAIMTSTIPMGDEWEVVEGGVG